MAIEKYDSRSKCADHAIRETHESRNTAEPKIWIPAFWRKYLLIVAVQTCDRQHEQKIKRCGSVNEQCYIESSSGQPVCGCGPGFRANMTSDGKTICLRKRLRLSTRYAYRSLSTVKSFYREWNTTTSQALWLLHTWYCTFNRNLNGDLRHSSKFQIFCKHFELFFKYWLNSMICWEIWCWKVRN